MRKERKICREVPRMAGSIWLCSKQNLRYRVCRECREIYRRTEEATIRWMIERAKGKEGMQ